MRLLPPVCGTRLPLVELSRRPQVKLALMVEQITDKYPETMLGALAARCTNGVGPRQPEIPRPGTGRNRAE